MTDAQARIGIFGGTFNPVHIAHLRAAEEVVGALHLERMIFVPSADPPHKVDAPGDRLAPAEVRLEWVQLAIRNNPRFEVDALEIERGGASYSVDTLRTIGERIAPEKPVFTIGQDAFAEIDSWRDPEALFELAHFAVITRPPVAPASLADWLPRCIRNAVEPDPGGLFARVPRAGTWIRWVEIPAFDVSSSDIRNRLRDGESVRYLLPPAVEEAVEKSGAYCAAKSRHGG
jgi:nicotinate-nucleotide adenylyltransferase